MDARIGTKKVTVKKQGARGVFSATVYKPTVNGRVVGNLSSGYEGGALKLAQKWLDRNS